MRAEGLFPKHQSALPSAVCDQRLIAWGSSTEPDRPPLLAGLPAAPGRSALSAGHRQQLCQAMRSPAAPLLAACLLLLCSCGPAAAILQVRSDGACS